MPETWIHDVPMRWGDLDILHHVTNVVYVDYAIEAQAMLEHDGLLTPDRPVREVTISYGRPTLLSERPIVLRTHLDGDVLTQEICATPDGEPVVHATMTTTFGPPSDVLVPASTDEPLAARLRTTDLGAGGVASLSGQFRLVQEARIAHFTRMGRTRMGQFVVGRIVLRPIAPIAWQREPLQAQGQITRVGRGSFTITTTMSTDVAPVFSAETVLVGFDLDRQSSRPLGEDERDHLTSYLSAG